MAMSEESQANLGHGEAMPSTEVDPLVNGDGKHILAEAVSNSSWKMEEHELQFQIAVKDEDHSESKLAIGSIVNDNMLKTEKLEVDELQYEPPVNDENLSEPEIAIGTTVNEILLETEKMEEHELPLGTYVNDHLISEIAISALVNENLFEVEKMDELELQLETSVREESAGSSNEIQEKETDKERTTATCKHQLLLHRVALERLKKDLSDLTEEKVTLVNTVADLNLKLSMNENLCKQLEDKLDLADQILTKTESLLSQALLRNKELEKKYKFLGKIHDDMKIATNTVYNRNLELEDLLEASKLAEKSIKENLWKTENRLSYSEKCNAVIKQHMNLTEMKCLEAERKKEELITFIRKIDEKISLSTLGFEGHDNTIGQLEFLLNKSLHGKTDLSKENYDLHSSAENLEHVTGTHWHSLEPEFKLQSSHLKSNIAVNEVGQLKLSLETANHQVQEFEKLMSSTKAKREDVEIESKRYMSKVSSLLAEIDAYKERTSSLEALLHASKEKERELIDALNANNDERKKIETLSDIQGKDHAKAQDMIENLPNKCKSLEVKMEIADEEFEASVHREQELVEKLNYTRQQLVHQEKALEESTVRSKEMILMNEALVKDLEFKLQEATLSFKQNESQVIELFEKLKFLEEEKAIYKDEAVEANEIIASLKAELEANAVKSVSLENKVEELNHKILQYHSEFEEMALENEMMAGTNSKLQTSLEAHQLKLEELNQFLSSNHAEMEVSAKQLASNAKTMEKLMDENSGLLELQSAMELRLKDTEVQLHVTIEKLEEKEYELTDLKDKMLAHETQLRNYEDQLSELTVIASNRRDKLVSTLKEVHNLETTIEQLQRSLDESKNANAYLTRKNLSLSQDLAAKETKMKELLIKFDTIVIEKDVMSSQLHSFKEEIVALMQRLNSDREMHQLQMTTSLEENDKFFEAQKKNIEELEARVINLEEQLSESKTIEISLKTHVENLKAELADGSLMQEHNSKLEQKRELAEKRYMEKTKGTKMAKEKEAIPINEQHASVVEERNSLLQQLKKVQNELSLARRIIEQQAREGNKKPTLVNINLTNLSESRRQTPKSKEPTFVNINLTDLRDSRSQTPKSKEIADPKNKLKETPTVQEEVENTTTQDKSKDVMDVSSKYLVSGAPRLLHVSDKAKDPKIQARESTSLLHPTTQVDEEDPMRALAFMFILGVALFSMLTGIFLGRRY